MSDIASLVGQSLMFRFIGPEFTASDREAFNTIRPGGVLFFGDNLTSREQIRALTTQLQQAAREEGMPPLLIAADQEGGIVTRLPVDMVTVSSAMGLGALPVGPIRESARLNARQLREVGINQNYAPTADVNSNPQNPVIRTRSFGESQEIVSAAVLATVAGFEDEGVIATLKHFPGHGDTHVDSHHGLPFIDKSVEEMHRVELAPFKAAIAAGVHAIMTAHIVFPALDDAPATLSKKILTGLLREELGFDGLIVTDSMSMHAIADGWGLEEAAILAKEAGVDMLESSEAPDSMLARHAALVGALQSGRLDESIFTATIARLDKLRATFNVGESLPGVTNSDEIRQLAQSIAKQTIRTASGKSVPELADAEDSVIIAFARLRNLEIVDRLDLPVVMEHAIATNLPHATMITLSSDPTEAEINTALQAASGATAIVIATRDAIQYEYQRELGMKFLAAAPESAKRIHVNLRGPYDTGIIGDVDETVYTYGDAVVSLLALAELLTGR